MATVTVKNIPEGLYRKLRNRAAAHRRSINSEIIISLERHLGSTRVDPEAFLARMDDLQKRSKLGRVTGKFIQQAKVWGRA